MSYFFTQKAPRIIIRLCAKMYGNLTDAFVEIQNVDIPISNIISTYTSGNFSLYTTIIRVHSTCT